jgi:uncharacterized protein DUF3309
MAALVYEQQEQQGESATRVKRKTIPNSSVFPLATARRCSFAKAESHECVATSKEQNMLGTVLIVILVLALLGALPRWSHSRDWGYYPTGGVGLLLFVIAILLMRGRI